MFFPMKETGIKINACEDSRFFDLFPLGFIVSAIVLTKQKKKGEKTDLLLKILIVISIILGYFCIFGVPEIISKVTLLKFSTANRAYLAFGFVNVLILLRSISIYEEKISIKNAFIITFLLTLFAGMQVLSNYVSYTGKAGFILICMIIFVLSYLILRKKDKLFAIFMIIIMCISGLLVNPIRVGVDVIYEADISKAIQEIAKNDKDANWIYEGNGYPNILIANGAKTINSTNVYPKLETWYKIDKEKKYEDIYNRYAHISIYLQDTKETSFELSSPDSFIISLNENDLITLEIKYVLTKNNLKIFDNENIKFNEKYHDEYFYIYEVDVV